jgi:hypothetical protein
MTKELLPSQHTPNLPSRTGAPALDDAAPGDAHPDVLPVGQREKAEPYPGSGIPGESWQSMAGAKRTGLRRA